MNLSLSLLIEQIDSERRENNAKFISPEQTKKLMNRSLNILFIEPGIKTVPEIQTLTASGSTTRYALESDFKEVISIWSGEGTNNGIKFEYKPIEEFNSMTVGYAYTFIEDGYIEIKFPDVGSLPSTSIVLRYWSTNIILDADGVTKKSVWENDEDVSRIKFFDEYFIQWVTARIIKREGKKEWEDYMKVAREMIASLKEQPASKTSRPRRTFGHYQINP